MVQEALNGFALPLRHRAESPMTARINAYSSAISCIAGTVLPNTKTPRDIWLIWCDYEMSLT